MAMTRRDLMLGAMGAAVLSAGPGIAGTIRMGGPAFGSSWRANLDASAGEDTMRHLIQGVIADIDACLSPYRPKSQLSRCNATRSSDWQPVHPMLGHVTRVALRVARLTDGYFDPAVGPLVARQGFGPIAGRAARYTDFEADSGRLRKRAPDATLDLCGIAKGYALDRIVLALKDAGLGHGIVEVGGEVSAFGTHPEGRDWAVAIADPSVPGTARRIIALRGLALATSGHAANGVRGRVSASHIIDPHRLTPAAQSLRAVSVLHPSGMWADALATALCAAGPDVGADLARRLGLRALFILDDAEQTTGGFETHVLI